MASLASASHSHCSVSPKSAIMPLALVSASTMYLAYAAFTKSSSYSSLGRRCAWKSGIAYHGISHR